MICTGCGMQEDHAVILCPLHAAAPDLLKACKAARISLIDDETYAQFKPLLKTLEDAIAKAQPPKERAPDWFA